MKTECAECVGLRKIAETVATWLEKERELVEFEGIKRADFTCATLRACIEALRGGRDAKLVGMEVISGRKR